MTNILIKAGTAALIALGAIASTGSTASAAPGDFGYGRPAYHHDRSPRGVCSPIHAVQKARWQGLNRARIADITPRRIVVTGRNRGGRDRIVFANVRGCPIIRR